MWVAALRKSGQAWRPRGLRRRDTGPKTVGGPTPWRGSSTHAVAVSALADASHRMAQSGLVNGFGIWAALWRGFQPSSGVRDSSVIGPPAVTRLVRDPCPGQNKQLTLDRTGPGPG